MKKKTLQNRVRPKTNAVKQLNIATLPPCLLCGKVADYTALYRSNDGGKVFGAPEGKTRYIVYYLCARCASNRQIASAWAEARIHAILGDEAYKPLISAIGEESGHAN